MPTSQLDLTYQEKRLEMSRKVEELAAQAWLTRDWKDRSTYLDRVIPIVEGGMMTTAALVNAYLNAKVLADSGVLLDRHINPDQFDIEGVRGVPAREVYERPFGTLGVKMAAGADFKDADTQAADYVRKLAATDLQACFTKASHLWMTLYGHGVSDG